MKNFGKISKKDYVGLSKKRKMLKNDGKKLKNGKKR